MTAHTKTERMRFAGDLDGLLGYSLSVIMSVCLRGGPGELISNLTPSGGKRWFGLPAAAPGSRGTPAAAGFVLSPGISRTGGSPGKVPLNWEDAARLRACLRVTNAEHHPRSADYHTNHAPRSYPSPGRRHFPSEE